MFPLWMLFIGQSADVVEADHSIDWDRSDRWIHVVNQNQFLRTPTREKLSVSY